MVGCKSGKWISSSLTGIFHYHTKSPHHDYLYTSACYVHKINDFHYETKRKLELDEIPRPDRICKNCLILTKQTINIFDYIDDIEETVNELIPIVDCLCKIPNIEIC